LLYSYHNRIPKSQRYTLWQKCENTTLSLLEALIETGHKKGDERLHSLYVISDKLDLFKVLIRLAKDTRTIHSPLPSNIQEIGKMIQSLTEG